MLQQDLPINHIFNKMENPVRVIVVKFDVKITFLFQNNILSVDWEIIFLLVTIFLRAFELVLVLL